MTCARYDEVEIAERYALGQMDEAEQAAFEEHFFECDECFASVQLIQQTRTALGLFPREPESAGTPEMAGPMRVASSRPAAGAPAAELGPPRLETATSRPAATSGPRDATGARRSAWSSGRGWIGLAIAASLLLGIVWWQSRGAGPAADDASLVARQDPSSTPAPPADAGRPGGSQTSPPATPGGTSGGTGAGAPSGTAAQPGTASGGGTAGTGGTSPATPGSKPAPVDRPAPAAPPRDLGVLALIVPPPYVPLRTRGPAETQAQTFAAAMERYNARDYAGAAAGLQPLAEAQPDAAHVQFFLGISLLMVEKPGEARTVLERAVATGTPPFADEAHFYLAKAAIGERQLTRAERELEIAIEREAGPPGEAAKLLRELKQIPR